MSLELPHVNADLATLALLALNAILLMRLQGKAWQPPLIAESATSALLALFTMSVALPNVKAHGTIFTFPPLSALLLMERQEEVWLHPLTTKSTTLQHLALFSMSVEMSHMEAEFTTIALLALRAFMFMGLHKRAFLHPQAAESAAHKRLALFSMPLELLHMKAYPTTMAFLALGALLLMRL